ncbi:MAG: hypothetical protein KAT75_04040 [Dehalococcoidia bacterium]|nr:hypothetical protein [Dehalococcoidia bacterium]
MPFTAWQAILGLGLFFVLMGIAFVLWNRKETRTYYTSLASRRDLKEFITHEPKRPWLGAWGVGGRISLVIGGMLLVAAAVLWLVSF